MVLRDLSGVPPLWYEMLVCRTTSVILSSLVTLTWPNENVRVRQARSLIWGPWFKLLSLSSSLPYVLETSDNVIITIVYSKCICKGRPQSKLFLSTNELAIDFQIAYAKTIRISSPVTHTWDIHIYINIYQHIYICVLFEKCNFYHLWILSFVKHKDIKYTYTEDDKIIRNSDFDIISNTGSSMSAWHMK